ncbi:16S rRNA (cytosine(1402)-N(4))-methyltransferase RsmH [Brooklawnia cerclae]|uniref:Ribosomal RNA small subunit methyltransferase H n=1 Tax=Brooklawnia cerclae TaxID=349934 RepID=A0ABX0SLB7_9ACTN|nr:16S rRNA (cytosine(1402)-N(4))-methyltransferase RsmH [Brooklawnia cerclae]NIH57521.1 16S rRNA (cytosine1402-N4)-methyltransferase [Brooklawnia cerclae]
MGTYRQTGRPRCVEDARGSSRALPAFAADASGTSLHIPVMRERIVEILTPALEAPGAVVVDCTLGMAGHASAVLAANPQARLVGIDRDADALAVAEQTLSRRFAGRFDLVRARFDEIDDVLDDLGVRQVQAVLADLGLSSLQIDRRERGFAYAVDAPLDMRMDVRSGRTAADVLNTYSKGDLVRVLRAYGEEPNAVRIARAIVTQREREPFERSARLVETIDQALPAAVRHSGGHPAKRTFQALRIEVNGELDALAGLLPAALDRLSVGGRMAVLAYHSLEDRMVKQTFAVAISDAAPPRLPVVPDDLKARFASLTKGAEKPHPTEVASNPRAASARLRAVRRIRPGTVPTPEEHR